MADKFCDPTLSTGLNDGTSVANAWQDLDTIMTGTLPGGSINAGDVIHIRSDNGSGADNSVSLAGEMTPFGTAAQPVYWYVDDGTHWSNPATLSIQHTGTTWIEWSRYNIFDGRDRCIFEQIDSVGNRSGWIRPTNQTDRAFLHIKNCTIRTNTSNASATGISVGQHHSFGADAAIRMLEGCTIGPMSSTGQPMFSAIVGDRRPIAPFVIRNCTIDTNGYAHAEIFELAGQVDGAPVALENCTFINTNANARLVDAGRMELRRCNMGLIPIGPNILGDTDFFGHLITASDVDCVPFNFAYEVYNGLVTWEAGANYPVLNAILPDDANTGFSWRVLPNTNITTHGVGRPFDLPRTSKLYTSDDSLLIISAEILLNNSFGTPNDDEIWLTISYIDENNIARTQTTLGTGAALTTSTALWSSTTYGANSYNRFKMEITTSHLVKEDSIVEAFISMTLAGSTANDFMFFDPELGMVETT